MTATNGTVTTDTLRRGEHVCWVVDDNDDYTAVASRLLDEGRAARQKPVAFGPGHSASLLHLAEHAAISVDPAVTWCRGAKLEPERMFEVFHEQAAVARSEGYGGLRVVADMDWLLGVQPTEQATLSFEVLLDRVVAELDATVFCAYRRSSFDDEAISGLLSVHPGGIGAEHEPSFRLTAQGGTCWALTGEVDFVVASKLEVALRAALEPGDAVVDVAALEFIDVAGMRALATASRDGGRRLVLRGAPALLRRTWQLAQFAAVAPRVELVA